MLFQLRHLRVEQDVVSVSSVLGLRRGRCQSKEDAGSPESAAAPRMPSPVLAPIYVARRIETGASVHWFLTNDDAMKSGVLLSILFSLVHNVWAVDDEYVFMLCSHCVV